MGRGEARWDCGSGGASPSLSFSSTCIVMLVEAFASLLFVDFSSIGGGIREPSSLRDEGGMWGELFKLLLARDRRRAKSSRVLMWSSTRFVDG